MATALGVVMLDATTKMLAGALAAGGLAKAFVVPTQNPDFALGVASPPFPIMLVLAGLGILCFGGYTVWQASRRRVPAWVPGLVIGGAVANLSDRLLFGAVHDWLYLPKVTLNLADVAITIGMIGYVLALLLPRKPRFGA